ncbi:MAG: glutamate formimidoyltransferase [Acidobacteria bacterium]|nr:glutamate formimidoyltransferase [Acidobacteriota bacterium]
MKKIVECVPNFSEGRDAEVVDQIADAIAAVRGVFVLDREMDSDHHRSVITYAGEPDACVEAAVRAAAKAAQLIDLTQHHGAHPRMGALDVLPFVPIKGVTMDDCIELAQRAGERIARELKIPVYLYEKAATKPTRVNLADVRKGEFEGLRREVELNPARQPDFGEPMLHPTAGAVAVGARAPLIAYNINLGTDDLNIAKQIARAVRGSSGGLHYVKALGVELKNRGLVQVTMNLVNHEASPMFRAFELVKLEADRYGVAIVGSEIVGLVPQAALAACADYYLRFEDFSDDLILENRLQAALEDYDANVAAMIETETELPWLGSLHEAVAAGDLSPGGGSVAAYAGSLAAALGVMTGNLTLGKKKYENVEAEIRELIAQLDDLSDDLRAAIPEDSDSQERALDAIRMPRASEAERLARDGAIEEATKALVTLRLRVAGNASEILDLLDELSEIGNPIAFADLAVGAQLALTALRGAAYQIFTCLGSIADPEFTNRHRAELDEMLTRGQDAVVGVEERFFKMYPR